MVSLKKEELLALKPGEIRILRALLKEPIEPKTFTKLFDATNHLNRTFLSKYLKRLIKIKLIKYNVETRKYNLEPVCEDILYFKDISDFLLEKTKGYINSVKGETGLVNLEKWTV
ncbi:MAG: hypothetical protein ACXACP_02915, partial [Candidatus Hodarchaeales archaeon]